MADINRFSSRRQRLDHTFLRTRLKGAKSYKRIAGYFRSSIFELVGEEIADIPHIQIVCNSELDAVDVAVSKHARETAFKERWNEAPAEVEALLHRDRYRRLHALLTSGRAEVRVVPKDCVFVHGKAGIIEAADGSKTCFLGSINETKSGFAENYEILWEDTSSEGVAWVEEEFEALWQDSYPLPDAIVEEIKRVADRVEIRFEDAAPGELAAAALAESPIYRGGEQLQPWQRSFVTMFLQHRETYGKARLLLADEVGLGKTLSLAASAVLSALLDDGPVLILCPSTLTLQWQVELKDKLGIPSAVWSSTKKVWIDANGHLIKTRGPEDIACCPFRIAIVSTGLIFQASEERQHLLARKFGTVVLDEAHKARQRGGLGDKKEPNNLLDFMLRIGPRTRNLLLGTATPIQIEVYELWDLMRILNTGADAVLGRELLGRWTDWEKALPLVKGDETPADGRDAWEWLRNPLPPGDEETLFAILRLQLGLPEQTFFTDRGFGSLGFFEQQAIGQTLAPGFFKDHNPIVRHTVLRRRQTLEEAGLLDRVGVDIHPAPDAAASAYPGVGFSGLGLLTNHPFDLAYRAAEALTAALQQSTKAAGFMKTLLLQRICSSFASGRSTADKMLRRDSLGEEEEQTTLFADILSALTPDEAGHLRTIIDELSRPEARDPKLAAVRYFLTEHRTEGKTWLEHGCIIFSQYYDTASWIGSELAKALPSEPVAVYAGTGKSGLFRGEEFAAVEREEIKTAVKKRGIRLVVATDAACEGLNLQTLGTLINVDLPWNPSRLEQRLGRIKRFGQARRTVDMLNLVYHDTQDEKVYQVVSRRLKDKFDIFGGLPDMIEDESIENVEKLEAMTDQYVHLRQKARDVFELRYKETIDPDANRWELCSRVLSRRDVIEKLSEAW
jgi:SNF2 family DNA or RNA helicase